MLCGQASRSAPPEQSGNAATSPAVPHLARGIRCWMTAKTGHPVRRQCAPRSRWRISVSRLAERSLGNSRRSTIVAAGEVRRVPSQPLNSKPGAHLSGSVRRSASRRAASHSARADRSTWAKRLISRAGRMISASSTTPNSSPAVAISNQSGSCRAQAATASGRRLEPGCGPPIVQYRFPHSGFGHGNSFSFIIYGKMPVLLECSSPLYVALPSGPILISANRAASVGRMGLRRP